MRRGSVDEVRLRAREQGVVLVVDELHGQDDAELGPGPRRGDRIAGDDRLTELIRPPRPAVSWTVTLGLKEARQKSGLVGAGQSTFTGMGVGVIVRSMWAEFGASVGVGEGVGSVLFAQSQPPAASTNSATATVRCREPTVWSFSTPTSGRGPRA